MSAATRGFVLGVLAVLAIACGAVGGFAYGQHTVRAEWSASIDSQSIVTGGIVFHSND